MVSPDVTMQLSQTEKSNVLALVSSSGDYTDMALDLIRQRDEVENVEAGDTPGSAYMPEVGTENDNKLSYFRFNIFLTEGTKADEFIGTLAGELQSNFDMKGVSCRVRVSQSR